MLFLLQGDRVLIVNAEMLEIRHDAEHRLARLLLKKIDGRRHERDIAAKLIDDESFDERALLFIEQLERPDKRGERAPAVDIGNEEHGRLQVFGDAHVDDVILLEVDLRRAARPLDDDGIELLLEPGECCCHMAEKLHGLPFVILSRAHVSDGLPIDNDLRAGIPRRFQEDGIHIHHRRESCRLRLCDLGASHLAAVLRHIGVERHVLRFERHDATARLIKDAAERCRENAFADMGACAHEHDGFRHCCSSANFRRFTGIPATVRYTASASWASLWFARPAASR